MDNNIQGQDFQSNLLDQNIFRALEDLRIFSILAIVVFLLSIAGFFILISYLSVILNEVSKGITAAPSGNEYIIAFGFLFSIASILLELISFIFLRSTYKILKDKSWKFKSSYTGMNLFFSGLILLLIGLVLIFSVVKLATPYILIGGLILIFIGGVMAFIGEIMGLIMGTFRLKDYFQESKFGTAGIMYIVGIFISVFGLIGAVFMYIGVKNVINRLKTAQIGY